MWVLGSFVLLTAGLGCHANALSQEDGLVALSIEMEVRLTNKLEALVANKMEAMVKELKAMKTDNEAMKTENEAMKTENEAMKTENEAMKAQVERLRNATIGNRIRMTYLGCYQDSGARVLKHGKTNGNWMTNEACAEHCINLGWPYSGTQYASFCLCGDVYDSLGPSTGCNMACSADSSQKCGGAWANSVYAIAQAESCEHRGDPLDGRRWKPKKGSRLSGHVFSTMTIKSRIMCAGLCQNNKQCCSFNYHASGGECELNDAGKDATANAVVADGWTWYHEY